MIESKIEKSFGEGDINIFSYGISRGDCEKTHNKMLASSASVPDDNELDATLRSLYTWAETELKKGAVVLSEADQKTYARAQTQMELVQQRIRREVGGEMEALDLMMEQQSLVVTLDTIFHKGQVACLLQVEQALGKELVALEGAAWIRLLQDEEWAMAVGGRRQRWREYQRVRLAEKHFGPLLENLGSQEEMTREEIQTEYGAAWGRFESESRPFRAAAARQADTIYGALKLLETLQVYERLNIHTEERRAYAMLKPSLV